MVRALRAHHDVQGHFLHARTACAARLLHATVHVHALIRTAVAARIRARTCICGLMRAYACVGAHACAHLGAP